MSVAIAICVRVCHFRNVCVCCNLSVPMYVLHVIVIVVCISSLFVLINFVVCDMYKYCVMLMSLSEVVIVFMGCVVCGACV